MTLIIDQDAADAGDKGEQEQKYTELQESADDLGIGDDDQDPNELGEGEEPEGEEPEPQAESEPEPEAPGKPPKTIPYDRFREVNEAKKAATERAAQLEQQLAQMAPQAQRAAELEAINAAKPTNEAELTRAVKEARKRLREAEFDDDEAAKEAAEEALIAAEDARADARAHAKEVARAQVESDRQYAQALTQVLTKYPDIKSNEEMEADVVAARDLRLKRGMSAKDALIEAADAVAKRWGLTSGAAPAQQTAKSTRRERSLERHLDAAERQPSRTGPAGEGVRTRPAAAGRQLTREEHERLSPEDLAAELGIG